MGKLRHGVKIAACVLAMGAVPVAQAAAPAAKEILAFQPVQNGVVMTTPTEAEAANCKVELVSGPGAASGWALKDAQGNLLRKFVASKGAKAKIDVKSFYFAGQEVYREIDSNENGKVDQYRWFNTGGQRWGISSREDGRIDGWRMISAEEVSQELLKAIVTKDVARFQALLINEGEIKSLELPQSEAVKLATSASQAPQKFSAIQQALALTDKAQWMHLDVQSPQCVPAEQSGGKADYIHYKNATFLYEHAGKHEWITLGEMVQVGRVWRLVTGPVAGNVEPDTGPNVTTTQATIPDALKPLVAKLEEVDKNAPKAGAAPALVARSAMDRAAVLEQIVAKAAPTDREQWIKQLADSFSTAAQNAAANDTIAITRMNALRDQFVKAMPGNPLTGYIVFRAMSADYTMKVQNAKGPEIGKIQDAWRDQLKAFVDTYPTSEDAADAALQYAMVCEFAGKEADAKDAYTKLVKNYAQSPLAAKANGALRRLSLEGQAIQLAGPTLNGQQFNIAQLQGRTVVVYYWASWNNNVAAEFAKLQQVMTTFKDKNVAVVTVNLDSSPQQAIAALQAAKFDAITLHTPGGLESPLAADYGVMVLPNLFLVDKSGKVASRTVQMNTLEEEIKKLTEK